jgi:hypothetical protein
MPLEIESRENCITLHASLGAVRWLFLAFGFGVPLLMWWLGHLRLDGSSELGRYFVSLFLLPLVFWSVSSLPSRQHSISTRGLSVSAASLCSFPGRPWSLSLLSKV